MWEREYLLTISTFLCIQFSGDARASLASLLNSNKDGQN